MSGEKEQHHIPSWDGSARSWRRYTKEVSWFVQSTAVNKRRYCASRLLSRLTGPARLLAMSWSWNKMHFDTPEGTKLFLQRLASSPLVRKNLPNATAICNQYFAFQRRSGENISSFLVRESLVHEEFCEAIIRLHEDRLGISQESRDFGLPPEETYSWDDESWAGATWWRDEWGGDDPDPEGDPEPAPGADSPEARAGDAEVLHEGATTSAAPGSSPSHGGDRSPLRRPSQQDVRPSAEQPKAVDELALADSFIMEVLRGWRLLQAAGLNAEEKRDILSTTKNSLDYEVIAAALQNLWDEQLLGQRQGSSSYHAHYSEAVDAETSYYQDAWWQEDDAWWYEDYFVDGYYDDSWWENYAAEGHEQMVASEPEDPESLAKYKEAQQAEKIAEGLAAEAQRTWAEAQRATQALRKDRGFGAMSAQGPSGGCYLCGGPHFSRDCPRRSQMSFGKGPKGSNRFSKGKAKGYMNEMDEDYYANAFKGKSKGKGKKGYYVDPAYAMWSSKGKGKSKSKDSYRPVNAYQSELFVGGLDMVLEAAAASSEPVDPNVGMIDCGATASAAPEAVVKGLINAVLAQDRSAQIEMDQASRPYFRFGNGRWGRALCKVRFCSRASGSPKHFALYVLPNPTEYYQADFDKGSLVPVLIGMDHIGPTGVGMMIDFASGLAMNTSEPNPSIYKLDKSKKGHYVLDIVRYLTNGIKVLEGQAHVVVRSSSSSACALEQQVIELRTMWFDMAACDHDLSELDREVAEARMWQLYDASRTSSVSSAIAAQVSMHGPSAHRLISTPSSSCSPNVNAILQQAAKAKAKAKAKPLDMSRAQKIDSRDPRAHKNQWPCLGQHSPSPAKGNGHGQWIHCQVCDVRLLYVPRHGSTGQNTQCKNPEMVSRCLRELRKLLGDRLHSAPLVHAMQAKIDAEETLKVMINNHLATPTATSSTLTGISLNEATTSAAGYQTENPESPESLGSWAMTNAQGREVTLEEAYAALESNLPLYMGKKVMNAVTLMMAMTSQPKLGNDYVDSDNNIGERKIGDLPDPSLQIYFEWPTHCHGWKQPPLEDLANFLEDQGIPWLSCRIDGCNYGMKNPQDGLFVKKQWTVRTTDEQFHKSFRAKVCPGCHGKHSVQEDYETNKDAYYPWKMVQSIVKHWCASMTPSRHYQLLSLRQDLPSLQDEDPQAASEQSSTVDEAVCDWPDSEYVSEGDLQGLTSTTSELSVPAGDLQGLTSTTSELPVPAGALEDLINYHLVRKNFSFDVLEDILMQQWSGAPKSVSNHTRWRDGAGQALLLGAYSHGNMKGISRTSFNHVTLLKYINGFLRYHLPDASWSSVMVSFNRSVFPHRDHHNDKAPMCVLQSDVLACFTTVEGDQDSHIGLHYEAGNATYRKWEAQVSKFHRAAGHPTNRNLARIVEEAGHDKWKVEVARHHHCPSCQSLKPGGTSSGQVPPTTTHALYPAWHAIGVDSGEWVVPNKKQKVKFLVFVDVTTKLRVVQPLHVYDFLEMKTESPLDGLGKELWFGCFHEFASSLNIQVHYIAEKEHWAHGTVEAVVQDIKMTASAIQLEALDQDPRITLQLAASALNSTEYTAGFSAYQWAFGKHYDLSDEDVRTFTNTDYPGEFIKLVTARQQAETIATKTRALRVLSKLSNTTVRQPLRSFSPMDLVKVWRKVWPKEQYKGPRGGLRMSGRPHWVGPGRVIFCEVIPHQEGGDVRRHVCWVLIGKQLFRCSVHSVRPVTSTERFQFETSGEEQFHQWKTLKDVLPQREFVDLTDQEPSPDEVELPNLPQQPDKQTIVDPPSRRVRAKTTPTTTSPMPAVDDEVTGNTSAPSTIRPGENVNDHDLPVPKKARQDDWVEDLAMEAQLEAEHDIFKCLETIEEPVDCMKIEFEVGNLSNRQRKFLERNPVSFMVKKMRDSEVSISRLTPSDRRLFDRAKMKEVESFLKHEAVRKCLSQEEVQQAFDRNRIIRARWVLTWKAVPPEDQTSAADDAKNNAKTTHTADGTKKAKARIVLLGFEHPSLLDSKFKTASPVQSTLGRNLLYTKAMHEQWDLEGLDISTAFLQTMPTEADREIWTYGVEELREALGVGSEGIMRILRNVYGSTTAPRGLWLDLHRKLTALGAQAVLGERCLWIWLSKVQMDGDHPRMIGGMGGHVDDFHRTGDRESPEWLEVVEKINQAYEWGMIKKNSYRHAGTDVTIKEDEHGFKKLVVDQEYYIETLQDLEIPADRLRGNDHLLPREVEACRTALGALQWLAVQSQPQLCSRCNLLLTELVTTGTMSTALEIQGMICEIRNQSYALEFRKFPDAHHWSDIVFISMGDQAHSNRPKGDSTGGMLTLVAGPGCLDGKMCPMSLIGWRTWKLKRKAIGSNDAEVQSILEAEDQNFRSRLLWSELNGAGGRHEHRVLRRDMVDQVEAQIVRIKGVLCTDSKGGYDAVEVNESPLLGLSNMRAALQAFQLRDNLERAACQLRWLASDYDLADALTKKRADARQGLLRFLASGVWAIKYDPNFVSARKSKQRGGGALRDHDDHLRGDGMWLDILYKFFSCPYDDPEVQLMSFGG
ncbi:unnamed protein product [Symbiodinium sp. CCMP2592]|nr:unnamed protein product [Symbiodinium sp. CCMP2592]